LFSCSCTFKKIYCFDTTVPFKILEKGLLKPSSTSIKDTKDTFCYRNLLKTTISLRNSYKTKLDDSVLNNTNIAILTRNDSSYIATKLSIWLCGSAVVPLSPKYPLQELEYAINQSRSKVLVTNEEFEDKAQQLSNKTGVIPIILPKKLKSLNSVQPTLNDLNPCCTKKQVGLMQKPAMILYTSGTTGRPKGVLLNHQNLTAQVLKMMDEWKWNPSDNILHVLPLHHTHGIVNAMLCPLTTGAQVTMLPGFDAKSVWNYFLANLEEKNPLTVFMAVPTIYSKLIEYYEKELANMDKEYIKKIFASIRLMVSGSAALPLPVMKKWSDITGHTLLERYGMTEFGMGLTNSYSGVRIPGHWCMQQKKKLKFWTKQRSIWKVNFW